MRAYNKSIDQVQIKVREFRLWISLEKGRERKEQEEIELAAVSE